MQTIKEYHYVYKITNNKPVDERKYYIGVRTAKGCTPQEDVKYMSSSKYLKESIRELGLENFSKEILSIWDSRELANAEEIRLHRKFNVGCNDEFYNRAEATRDGFFTFNQVTVFDKREGITKNISKEDYEKYDYYHQCTKGTVVVKDVRDNSRKRVSKETYTKSDFYVSTSAGSILVTNEKSQLVRITVDEYNKNKKKYKHITTGKVPAIDTRDNSKKMVSVEDYHKFDYYKTGLSGKVLVFDKLDNKLKMINKNIVKNNSRYEIFNKNKITVIDIRDNSTKRVSKDDYEKYDYFVNLKSKRIIIFDDNDVVQYETYGNFEKICESNNLPATALKISYNNNGRLLYQNLGNQQISRLKNLGFYQYKGWYAEIVK